MADLAACTDYRLLSNAQLQSVDDDHSMNQIDAVVSRITDNLSQSFSAGEMAAELGMSESRFSRFFRRATGNTFTDFVNRVRINRACQLLMETERRITDICYEVGFNNVANFNRRFLEIKGITPSEFRKQSEKRFSGATA
jgi:AraC-like DNA-binding protein